MKVFALLLLELIVGCAALEEATAGHVGAHRQLTAEVPTCERLMGLANGEGSTFATAMRSCFSTDTFDASNNQWPSTVGNYMGTFSGTAVTVEVDATGAINHQPYLKGTVASNVAFGEIQGAGSFCAKTRYTGLNQQRILDGNTKNWLHGHWQGYAGVAHYDAWNMHPSDYYSGAPNTDWVTMCCQNAGPYCWVNGVKHTGSAAPGGAESVSINEGKHGNEKSDWGAAFIASWDYDLSDAQMDLVQHVMMSTYEYTDEPTPLGDAGSCFHASGAATLESGASKKMSELSLGDVVQIADEDGKLSFSQILLLPHKKNDELATFLNLTTESGKTTLMTPDHLIPRCGEMVILSMASELTVGDCLLTVDGKETLTEITSGVANGIYTAVTKAKFVVVDGIVASPFSRDSDRDHSMREYEELQKLLEDKQKVELDKSERKELSIAAKRLDTGGK